MHRRNYLINLSQTLNVIKETAKLCRNSMVIDEFTRRLFGFCHVSAAVIYSSVTTLLIMRNGISIISGGSVTSPAGFTAGAVSAGIKNSPNALDLALLVSEQPAVAAGVFTRNRFRAAPVILSQRRLRNGRGRAIVVNSGCANAGTGEIGRQDADTMTGMAGGLLGFDKSEVMVASTGVIGVTLPMGRVSAGLERITLSQAGGHDFARAIMTTDSVAKEIAVTVPEYGFTVGGCAKGAGMIHPDMATMLAFITTDAGIAPNLLRKILRRCVDRSFNLVSVDGDTSTNDSVFIMANGSSGVALDAEPGALSLFEEALATVCVFLAKAIARDGEGATRLIELTVTGTDSERDARKVVRTVLSSLLVKTAIHGGDPNWGRIVAAAGRSGVPLDLSCVSLDVGGIVVFDRGQPVPFDETVAGTVMSRPEIPVRLNLGSGPCTLTGWGCDLSDTYVHINADYTT
jgi:glutamate N-acetyltransferase/amino-acid N-acetyltransferase